MNLAFQQEPASLGDPSIAADAKKYVARAIDRLGGDDQHEGLAEQYAARKLALTGRIELYKWLASAEGAKLIRTRATPAIG